MNYAKYINYTSVYNIKHDNGILTVICSLAMKLHNGLHNKTANPCYYGSLHEVLNRNLCTHDTQLTLTLSPIASRLLGKRLILVVDIQHDLLHDGRETNLR